LEPVAHACKVTGLKRRSLDHFGQANLTIRGTERLDWT
jgi:hypothetical protein